MRFTRLLTQTGAALLVVGFFVVVGAIFTPTGSLELVKKFAESTPGLELTYRNGTLSDGIVLDQIFWEAPNGTTVAASDVNAGWNMTCWSQKVICLRETTIERITITIPPSDNPNGSAVSLPDIKPPLPIEARSLKINDLEIHKTGSDPVSFHNISLNAHWLRHEIKFNSLTFNWKDVEFTGDGAVELKNEYPLAFSLLLQTFGTQDEPRLTANATLSGEVAAIVLNASATLPFEFQTFGNLLPFERDKPLQDFHLRWQQAQWPLAGEPEIKSPTGTATFSGDYERLDIATSAQLAHPALPDSLVKISGRIDRSGIEVQSGQVEALGGEINMNGIVEWKDAVDWNLQVDMHDISPAEFWPGPITSINARAFYSGRAQDERLELGLSKVQGNLRYNGRPHSISGNWQLDADNNWHFDELVARSDDSEVRLNGTLGNHSSATAILSVDTAALLPAASGKISGRVDLSGPLHSLDLDGRLHSDRLSFDAYQLDGTTINFSIGKLLEKPSRLELTSQQIGHAGRMISAVQISASGTVDDHQIDATAHSKSLGSMAMALSGRLSDLQSWHGKLKSATATPDDYIVGLAAPVELAYTRKTSQLTLAPHCWQLNETSLCIDENAQIGSQGHISFHSENLNLSPLSAFVPNNLILAGHVESRGRVFWDDPAQPVVTLNSRITEAELIIDRGPSETPLSFDFTNAELVVDTSKGIMKSQLSFNSRQLGTITSVANIDTVGTGYPLTGAIQLSNADIRWLQQLTTGIKNLRGTASGEIQLGGSLSEPTIQGELGLHSTAFQSEQLQAPVTELTARIDVSGKQATFRGAAVAANAPVDFNGHAISGPDGLELDTTLAARGIALSNEFIDDADLDATIRIQLTGPQVETNGSVTLNSGTIKIGDENDGRLHHSSDVIVLQEISASSAPAPAVLRVSAGLDVVLGEDVTFRGWGLNTKLSGSLRAHLFSDKPPQVAGEISIDKGTYRSYGQDLTIRNGKIHFIGPPGQAALSAEAVRQQDTLTAGLRLQGSIQAPTATLFSEPALPDEEILSYLVLGRSLDDRSDRQAQLLANAALYVGLRNGQVVSDRIAEIFGVEDFYVTATGSGDDTQLMVSGQLTNRLLLRYGIGIFTPINTLYLRYDLAERLYVESTRGIERAVDLYYSFEF